jgi:microcystin-dependent protein
MATRTGPVFDSEIVGDEPDRLYQLPSSVPPMMRSVRSTGVVNGLSVTATAPASLAVDVSDGTCFVDGFFFEVFGGGETVTIQEGSASARTDRVVVKLDRTARTMTLAVITGTSGGGVPALPADHLPLALVPVGATASFVTAVTDDRRFSRPAGVPAGTVEMFAGSAAPEGWLLCNGQTVLRERFADLFDAIGTTYGAGNGTTTFAVPDLRTRFPVGSGTGHALGSAGGAAQVALTAAQMPSHSHAIDTRTSSTQPHSHEVNEYVSGTGTTSSGWTNRVQTTRNTGSGSAHENRPPYLSLNFLIRT